MEKGGSRGAGAMRGRGGGWRAAKRDAKSRVAWWRREKEDENEMTCERAVGCEVRDDFRGPVSVFAQMPA